MLTYAERAPFAAIWATQARTATIDELVASEYPSASNLHAPSVVRGEPALAEGAARAVKTMGWRDLAQSFAQDAAEMPIVSRLLAGQALLALGYAGLHAALALRERSSAGPLPTLVLSGLTVAVGAACAWGTLALVSRTRAAPAITAFFVYGRALREYLPARRPLVPAA